jgi:uncharacterized membrane protein
VSERVRLPARLALHAATSWLFVLVIAIQVLLAGAAITNLGGSGDYSLHVAFGHGVIGVVALAVVVTSVLAGVPRRDSAISFGLLLLYFVQAVLPAFASVMPIVAALHVLNALLLFAGAVWYARRISRGLAVARERPKLPL